MNSTRQSTRVAELHAIVEAYRSLTIEEAEHSDAGDREVEAVAELWRLEQADIDTSPRLARRHRAA